MEYTQRPNDTVGYLVVEAKSANGAIPISSAVVTITSANGTGSIKLTVETDISGKTERLTLPTVSRRFSEQPGTKEPYATYTVSVVADGHYPFTAEDVPIFNGITTVQPVPLIPLAAYDSDRFYPRGNLTVRNTEPFNSAFSD